MIRSNQSRRQILAGFAALSAGLAVPAFARAKPLMQVVKDPNCGCCSAWIAILQQQGFETEVHDTTYENLSRFKAQNGITPEMASCHTGKIEGYVVEGHVPPADILRLLAERPDAIGLSVPGMPFGSPGMGPESEREAYVVYLIRKDGRAEIFSEYDAA